MNTTDCLNVYFPDAISVYIYDILSHGIMGSCEAAKYGIRELIKYPESAFNQITKYCSIDMIKSLFPLIEGKIKVELMYNAIFYSLANGRKDVYDIIYGHEEIKNLNPYVKNDYDLIYKNCTIQTLKILNRLSKDTYKYKYIYKYDRSDLFSLIKKPSLLNMFKNDSQKIMREFAEKCNNANKLKCINAYLGYEKNFDDVNNDVIYNIIAIKNKRFNILRKITTNYQIEIIIDLLEEGHITEEEFTKVIMYCNSPSDTILLDIKDIKTYYVLDSMMMEHKISNIIIEQVHDIHMSIFEYVYREEIDKIFFLIEKEGMEICNIILNAAASRNNVFLIKKMIVLGAKDFERSILTAVSTNSMDAYMYLKPFVDTELFSILYECAVQFGSHYIIKDLIDYKIVAETNDRYTDRLLGLNNNFDNNSLYPSHYESLLSAYNSYTNVLDWIEN